MPAASATPFRHVFLPVEFEESAPEILSFAWAIARQARL